MTVKEQRRAHVLMRVLGGAITLKEAAVVMGVSVRHACLRYAGTTTEKSLGPGGTQGAGPRESRTGVPTPDPRGAPRNRGRTLPGEVPGL